MTDQADRAGSTAGARGFDPSRPNVARIYDYLLGGKDHFAADRHAAYQLIAELPNAATLAAVCDRRPTAAVELPG